MKIIEIYEYGNGVYAKPFWERVYEKINKVEQEYKILDFDKHFVPAHFVCKNCIGMNVYKGDEIRLILYCEPKVIESI